jgi:O-antigen ligase/tetratricopeptide (TPR) repeat protein
MKLEKILRHVLLGGVLAIPFIPLIVANNMFFPFITGKNFTFRILVEILFGAWIVLAYWNSAYRPRKSWILIALTAFVGIIALADFFGENPFKSIWSNYERMEGLVGLIHLYAYFLVAVAVLNTEKLWDRFWNVSLGVSVIMGIYGLFQLGGVLNINQGGVRVDGTFGNAAYLAVYTLFNIFIAAFMALKQKREMWLRVVYGAVALLNFVMLYYTATRGAILGLLGGVLLATALIALFEKDRPVFKKTAIGILAGVIIFIGGFFVVKDSSFVKDSQVLSRFSSISLHEKTTKSRFMVWNMAVQGFKERPVLGWGQENFNFVFNKYYNPGMYGQEPWFDRAHNVFFDWLIAGGLLGLLAYLSLFGTAIWLLWFRVKYFSVTSKSILTGLFAGYFFQNLFVFDNLFSYIMFFSLLGYIYTLSSTEGKLALFIDNITSRAKSMFSSDVMNVAIAPIAIIVVIFSFYIFNYKALEQNYTLLDALKPQKEGIAKNLELFKKAIFYDSFGSQEAREQLSQATFKVAGIADIPQEVKNSFVTLTDTELKKQIELVPNDARGQIFYASFLDRFGRYDDAIKQYEKALELSPKKQAIYFGLIGAYLNKGENKKALELAKSAFELAPEYKDARKIYAATAIYNKDEALAKELLVPVFGTTALNDDRIIRAYATVKRFDKVIQIWKERVKNNPKNLQFKFSLAAAYLGNNERTKAINEIKEIIKANPDFKKQGQYYISEIRAGRNP